MAFENAAVINKISKSFDEIYAVVNDEGELFDTNEFLPKLMMTINDARECQKIIIDDIWNRVFIVDGQSEAYYGKYVCCKDEHGEQRILLWKSDSSESYIEGLAHYISDFFEVDVSISDFDNVDWKKAYINLINGIRSFVNYHADIVPTDDIYGFITNLNDVETFGEEKAIWIRLKEQRNKLLDENADGIPVPDSREFLKAKYNGRCQICGNITPKRVQDPLYYTYRIVKQSKNHLSDLRYNLFCLCPTCHGELGYGRFMGQDMSDVVEKASMYASYIDEKINSGEMEDDFPSLVKELVDSDSKKEGFREPIICNVIVNGKKRKMAFSWEHFIRIAFVFSDLNDFDYEKVDAFEDY